MTAETWRNVVEMFFDQAAKYDKKPFLWAKKDGKFQAQSWAETAEQVAKLAGALKELGVRRGDRVAIISENRPEWLVADHAIMAIGAISVPAYTTYTERDYLHVLDNSGAKALVISSAKLAKTVFPAAHQAPALRFAVAMEPPRIGQSLHFDIHLWDNVLWASETDVATVKSWVRPIDREDLACLIYTSGTGGAPRGVKQHHGGLLHNCAGARDVIAEVGIGNDVFLSFLPASHAYEHTGGQFFPISIGAQIYYAESLDRLASNIEEARPTVMVVVPRLFEVLRTRIKRAIDKQGGTAAKLFDRAQELGRKRYEDPESLTLWEKIVDYFLDLTVRRKIRKRFGGRVKALVAGGAPLAPDVGLFFLSVGLKLLQGYGQTEAHPVISVNRLSDIKIDTVGPPLNRTEVKIAEDGEILVRGELVMQGYWQDEEATRAVLKEGWLHTGDVGLIDEDGHIKITDRKRDLIVNDKGDNVSPQRIEGMLALEPEIAQAMVYGDQRPYLVGLIVPDADWMRDWAHAEDKPNELATLCDDTQFVAAIDQAVVRVNRRLSNVEKIRRFAVLCDPFTVENKQMTPTLKIRRHVIRDVYRERIEQLYQKPQVNSRTAPLEEGGTP